MHSKTNESNKDLSLIVSASSDIFIDTGFSFFDHEVERLVAKTFCILNVKHEIGHSLWKGPLGEDISELS